MDEAIFLLIHYSQRRQIPHRALMTLRIRLSDQPGPLLTLCACISTPPFAYKSFIYMKFKLLHEIQIMFRCIKSMGQSFFNSFAIDTQFIFFVPNMLAKFVRKQALII